MIDQAMDYLLHNEGFEYSNNPLDAGGPTKYGITQRTYEAFLGRIVTIQEMKDLTIGEAKLCYEALYWTKLRLGSVVSQNMAIAIFDTGVLYGIVWAATLAQTACNVYGERIKVDGFVGPQTLQALNTVDPGVFITELRRLVLARIDTIIMNAPKNEAFRKGWTSRANRLLTLVPPVSPIVRNT